MAKNYYKILGVSKSSTKEEIKKAYRLLAKEFHPDKNKGNKEAEEKFKEISEAYYVLGDDKRRKEYDMYGSEQRGFQGQHGFNHQNVDFSSIFDQMFKNRGRRSTRKNQFSGFTDVFSDIFDDNMHFKDSDGQYYYSNQTPVKGQDLETSITIEFLEAVRGTEKVVSVGDKKIKLKIQKGIQESTKLRLKGQGYSSGAGAAGDLYITVHINPHQYFKREGNDIHLDVPITVAEAIKGGKIKVPTINGSLMVNVPDHIADKTTLRLKGKGIETASGVRGDQYLALYITLPKHITSKGHELLEIFTKENPYNPREHF